MAKIRILLTDDHTLFRQGIKTLIAAESDMEVVGEAANGTDAVTRAAETRPDIVLMDIGMTGGSYLSPRMLSQLVDDFRSRVKSTQRTPRFATLTTREKEVLKVLAEGNSVKEIAGGLNLSVKTVEAHKFNLMRKLDIHNKAQLV